ncbi:MAG: hypothetical protein Q8O03_08600 [Nanoarchaeota archaeon]|nr:hypothetical protein [Nanoarchaeota archaeon]
MLLDSVIDAKNKMNLVRELSLHPSWRYSINELEKKTGKETIKLKTNLRIIINK